MPRLERLSELSRKTLLTHPCLLNEGAPFTRLDKPVSAARLALVTTAGLHLDGDRLFTGGDQWFRVIPSDTPARAIRQSHSSIGFDRTAAMRDLNVIFPIDRVRELVQHGELGSLGPNYYSFLGAQRPPYDGLLTQSGPEVARRLRDEGVDVVLLTGT